MKIKLDAKVKVKLTKEGIRVNSKLNTPFTVDEEGFITDTLSNVMSRLGVYIDLVDEPLFEEDIIIVE